jgi:hypothetical protein
LPNIPNKHHKFLCGVLWYSIHNLLSSLFSLSFSLHFFSCNATIISQRNGLGTKQGNAALIALGQFFTFQNNSFQPAQVSLYTFSQRGELTSWNIDLTNPTPTITLAHRCYGHKSPIKRLTSHPSLPYCASLDESGCLLIWRIHDINVRVDLHSQTLIQSVNRIDHIYNS